jgi:glycosyltransferase involved in cell wall biosynthesis
MATTRVAFVVTGLEVGGAEVQLLRLADSLDPDRFQSIVMPLGRGRALLPEFERAGVRVVPRSLAALRAFRPNLVQGWMYHGNLAASLSRRLLPGRPPILWSVRGLNATQTEPRFTSNLAFRACDRLARTPRWIVNNSLASALAHETQCGYPADRRVVIPNGFDTELFRPRPGSAAAMRHRLGLTETTPIVGWIGRNHPDKDLPNFQQAALRLLALGIDAHFVLAGAGLPKVSDRHFTNLGAVGDVATLLPALDLVVSSSVRENFPNAIGEAMSCGVPCVATDVGDCAAVIGDTGEVAPARDAVALAQAMKRMLSLQPAESTALGARARQRIAENYTLAAVARRYETLYAQTLAEAAVPCAA